MALRNNRPRVRTEEIDVLQFEKQYYPQIVAGVDEAGRGPLAGPVVASAVIIDPANIIPGIKDSKRISKRKRERLYKQITENYIWSVASVSHTEIDEINILEATKKACIMAVEQLGQNPNVVLIDGNMKFPDQRFVSIIRGDTLSLSISAASIIAKVTRDNLMLELNTQFPEYNWKKNSGYGTQEHIDAINLHGLSPYHRITFKTRGCIQPKMTSFFRVRKRRGNEHFEQKEEMEKHGNEMNENGNEMSENGNEMSENGNEMYENEMKIEEIDCRALQVTCG